MISFILNEIFCDFDDATTFSIGMYINYMMLYDDIMILYIDEMLWGHGDGYVVLWAPMDSLW